MTAIHHAREWPPCADCISTVTDEGALRHSASCPIQRGLDEITDADRQYFEDHPGATERVREMTHAERQSLIRADGRHAHKAFRDHGYIRVVEVLPGIRLRQPFCIIPNGGVEGEIS